MNKLQRLDEIVSFIKKLTPHEKQLVRGLLKTDKKSVTVKRKNGKYKPWQIKRAWELTKKGIPAKEIAKVTKMKAASISKSFLKKRIKAIKRQEKKK